MCLFGRISPQIPLATKPIFKPYQQSTSSNISRVNQINAVYYPNWRMYRGDTPAKLNYNCISHVFYAFADVKDDGTIYLNDEDADIRLPVDGASGCLGSFMNLKNQYGNLKLSFSIGGGGPGKSEVFAKVASSPITRENFAKSARGLVDKYGFDGIDIDWEHPSNHEQGKNFVALLANLRSQLPGNRYLLSAALPAGKWALQYIDLRRANEYLDLINLMAYDFYGSWTKVSGHHSQLYPGGADENSGASGVDYIISTGFPAAKILFGIPAYGRSFLGVNGPNQIHNGLGGEDGVFDYKELPRQKSEEFVDTRAVAAYCVGGDGGFISYDNPKTVEIKAKFCKKRGLRGIFYWTGASDMPAGPRSLVSTSFKFLQKP